MRESKRSKLIRLIAEQRKWIEEHGENLAGYVARYGSTDEPEHHGDGGEAIFHADRMELVRLEKQLERIS